MIPLIDVVLVLLVIFIVTAPLMTNAVKLDLPKATSQTDVQKPEKIEFAINGEGQLFWNGERISREEAAAKFADRGPEAPAARSLPARRPGRGLSLRLGDAGRRLEGRPQQGRLRERAGEVGGIARTSDLPTAAGVLSGSSRCPGRRAADAGAGSRPRSFSAHITDHDSP